MPGALPDSPSSASKRILTTAVRRPAQFATTRWSIVLRAAQTGTGAAPATDALAGLCRTYWFPLYAHVRRRGYGTADAEDLTQEFFARMLARDAIAQADPQRGRFRTFILTALDHFLADEWAKAHALKRGGHPDVLSFDFDEAEKRLALEVDCTIPPDQAFDRQWAVELLRTVLEQLEAEYRRAGKGTLFTLLKPTLTGTHESQPYAELAAQLGRNENAVKAAVHRLRQRYRALLQAEVRQTVASADEAGAEMRALLQALGR